MWRKPPRWWYAPGSRFAPAMLHPAALAYGTAAELRFRVTRPSVSLLPVICVGNFTVGGAGKTPTAIAVAQILARLDRTPAFLTRGYGGKEEGPHLVDPEHDTAERVGDEALLLARHGQTVVSRRRPDGARFIEGLGRDCIVMDDGFQNPSLHKDFSLAVIDASVGLGNGRVFPAGPLRGALKRQLPRAHAILVLGGSANQRTALAARISGKPVLKAALRPVAGGNGLSGQRVVAFCGIGRPAKFFQTLEEMGAVVVQTVGFADHHRYTARDAESLLALAAKMRADLVTTEKDAARLTETDGPLGRLKAKALAVPVEVTFDGQDGERLEELLRLALRAARR